MMKSMVCKLTLIIALVIFIPVDGNCQMKVSEDVSLVPVAGDLEFVNMGEPNEEVIYNNPEGDTKLEIYYKGMTVYITAGEEIRFASGTGVLSAKGGVKFTDGESVAEGGSVWYNLYKRYGEFHGNPKFKKPVDETHWNYFECESMDIKVGDKGLSGMKFYKVRNSRLYLKKEELDKIKGQIVPEKSVEDKKTESPVKKEEPKKSYLLEGDASGREVKSSGNISEVSGERSEGALNRKISD
jgi:hypothetical protein